MMKLKARSIILIMLFVSTSFLGYFSILNSRDNDLRNIVAYSENDLNIPHGSALSDYIVDIENRNNASGMEDAINIVQGTNAYYTVGWRYMGDNGQDIYLIKWDVYGNFVWDRTWGGPGVDVPEAIYFESNDYDDIWITGSSDSWNTSKNIVILRYEEDGTLINNITWGGASTDLGKDICYVGLSDVFLLLGQSDSWSSKYEIVVHYWGYNENSMNLINNYSWGEAGYNYIPEAYEKQVITGYRYVDESSLAYEVFTYKFDTSFLGTIWDMTWSASSMDEAFDLLHFGSNIYVVGGSNLMGTPKLFILKYDYTSGTLSDSNVFSTYSWAMSIGYYNSKLYTIGANGSGFLLCEFDTSCNSISNLTWTDGGAMQFGRGFVTNSTMDSFIILGLTNVNEPSSSRDQSLYILAHDDDSDGLGNVTETMYGSLDSSADTDGDTMPDSYEGPNGLNPAIDDRTSDLDGDTLSNFVEYSIGSDPQKDDYAPQFTAVGIVDAKVTEGVDTSVKVELIEPHLDKVILSYKIDSTWTNSVMYLGSDNKYEAALICKSEVAGTKVYYKIYANDTEGNENVTAQYSFTISDAESNGIPGYSTVAIFSVSILTMLFVASQIQKKNKIY